MPLPLRPGDYTSPFFVTALSEEYQVQLYSLPIDRSPIDLDWKIMDVQGNVIASGTYRDRQQPGNTAVNLGEYRPRRGLRQRAIVDVSRGDGEASSDVRLHIGLPDQALAFGYGVLASSAWCVAVTAFGGVVLLLVWIRGRVARSARVHGN